MFNDFTTERAGTGTNEWAEHKYNIDQGCMHGCLYCYACESALRYNRINERDEWLIPRTNIKAVQKRWRKQDGVIMFPTTHDITPDNLEACTQTLRNMLVAGNQVLIVSKPHLECIKSLCESLYQYKDQILFRFTIGTLLRDLITFWEPGAPKPIERVESLKWAYSYGFKTSVSMEPMLDTVDATVYIFRILSDYVTETIWIGKMNRIRSRVDISDPNILKVVQKLEHLQRDEEILRLVGQLNISPKVRWKDSIKEVIKKYSVTEEPR